MSHTEQATQEERLPVLTTPQVERVLRWIADSNSLVQLDRYQRYLCAGAADEESKRIIDDLSLSYSSVSRGVSQERSMMLLKHYAAMIVDVRDGKE